MKVDGVETDPVNIFHDSYYNFFLVRWSPASLQVLVELNNTQRVYLSTSTPVPPNVWNLITVTQNGTLMTLYVNTTRQDVTGTNSGLMLNHLQSVTVWVGKSHWHSFNGSLDEFRIYNTSLTQQHVNSLFQNTAIPALSSNLITHWNFYIPEIPKSEELATMVEDLYSSLSNDYSSLSGLMFFPSLAAVPGNAPATTSAPASTSTSGIGSTTAVSTTESIEWVSVASKLTTTIIVLLSLSLLLL